MASFIDLEGASGASYRFRLSPPGEPHAAVAGLVAITRDEGVKRQVLLVEASFDLSRDIPRADALAGGHPGSQVWTRLNTPKPLREAEAEDLKAASSPEFALPDND